MPRYLAPFVLLAAILAVPFALRPKAASAGRADGTLVIISPHNEAIRHEVGEAFRRHVLATRNREIRIDWRSAGGASETARFLAGEFFGAFERYWRDDLGRPWTAAVRAAFDNPKIEPDDTPADDTPAEAARRAFLASDVGIGIDLFFGGGTFDFSQQAEAGRLVDSGVIARRPDVFGPGCIPQQIGGGPFWDPRGRWVGVVLAAFGICYNTDVLARLGVARPPAQWDDLGDPAYRGQIAATDPTKSGSAAKAFEMMVQQQMHRAGDPAAGWTNAMRLIQRIGGNARYFTDAGGKPAIDVAMGDAAAGIAIDFYARFQSEAVQRPDGTSRLVYVTPAGGSAVDADPIGLLRGAKNRGLAAEFIEWCVSPEAQKLWNFTRGTPGGPRRYALRRLPILPALYAAELRPFRSDPDVDAYVEAAKFEYRPEWTGPLFNVLRLVVRVMCLDPADELKAAWGDLARAGFPPAATAAFADVGRVDYAAASGEIRDALRSPDRIREVQMTKELADVFRANYRRASQLAKEGR